MALLAGFSTSESRGAIDSPFSDSKLLDACKLCCSVDSRGGDHPSYLRGNIENTAVFAIHGSLGPHVFESTATKFGEVQIDKIGFLEWMKDGNNQPASVHQRSLAQFLDLWNKPNGLQAEARLEYERGKTVVFTGQSMGGAIATLATLWMLEKQQQPGKANSFFCITFAFPLIGDEILARAVRRKKWTDQFCHVVLGRDVFSRILLVPSISVSKPLGALLPYWQRYLESAGNLLGSTDTPMVEALPEGISEFVGTVVLNCSALANYSSATYMSPNNPLMAAVKPLVKLSPYRPFGQYVFCSGKGGIRVENHFAVLPILYYTLQTSDANNEEFKEFILEHVRYGHNLPNALQNTVKLNELSDLPLSEARLNFQDSGTAQLDALGLGIQNCPARLSLRAAGQVLKQQKENVHKLENEVREKIEAAIKEIEEYRLQCFKNGSGYYDSFKSKQNRADFDANLNRLKLAGWWDEIIPMIEKDELPEDFQCSEAWIRLGTHYRLLVEPLDIANYYRLGKNEDSGPYIKNGRPRRYKTLQKWLEDDEVNTQLQPAPIGIDQPMMLTQDSCLWAYVEEISFLSRANNVKDLENTKTELEDRLRRLNHANGLSMDELVAGNSTFNTVVELLWTKMTPLQKANSPFSVIIGQHPELIN